MAALRPDPDQKDQIMPRKPGDVVNVNGDSLSVVAPLKQTSGYLFFVVARAPRSHRQVGDYVPKDLP